MLLLVSKASWGRGALVLVLLLVLILRTVLVLVVLQKQVQGPSWGCGAAVGRARRVL